MVDDIRSGVTSDAEVSKLEASGMSGRRETAVEGVVIERNRYERECHEVPDCRGYGLEFVGVRTTGSRRPVRGGLISLLGSR